MSPTARRRLARALEVAITGWRVFRVVVMYGLPGFGSLYLVAEAVMVRHPVVVGVAGVWLIALAVVGALLYIAVYYADLPLALDRLRRTVKSHR